MNKYIFTIISFLLCSDIYSQGDNYISPKKFRYFDHTLSKQLMDSLKNTKVSNFLLYQTHISRKYLNQNLTDSSIVVTFFIWKQNEKAFAKLITETTIYKEKELSSKIFKYPFLNKVWLKESDDKTKFVSPAILPDHKKLVLYYSNNTSGFFEYGKNLFFEPDPKLDKYKKEFIQILDNEFSKSDGKWEFYKSYNRYDEFLKPL